MLREAGKGVVFWGKDKEEQCLEMGQEGTHDTLATSYYPQLRCHLLQKALTDSPPLPFQPSYLSLLPTPSALQSSIFTHRKETTNMKYFSLPL